MKILGIQGDLRIIKIDKIPEGAKKRPDNTIMWGETTGNRHILSEGSVYDYEDRILLTIPANTTIIHDEHLPIPLEKGDYEVIRQREYANKDAVKLVVD